MSERPEYLDQDHVKALLETMRSRLAKGFGVTLQSDPNGAWGPMGANYLTLRFSHHEEGKQPDHIEVMMVIKSVSSERVEAHVRYDRENPQ